MQYPLIMAHMATRHYGRENSVETLLRVLPYRPDIIELDVRKSRDGVLFCYHGWTLFGCFWAYFLQFCSFTAIQRWLHVSRLEELLSHIPKEPTLFLDLKQRTITALDLAKVLGKITNHVWLAAYSVSFLGALRARLGTRFVYVYNFGFFRWQRGIRLAKKYGIKIIQLFFWQLTERHWQLVSEAGLQAAACSFFLSRRKYLQLARRHPSVWVFYDDLGEVE